MAFAPVKPINELKRFKEEGEFLEGIYHAVRQNVGQYKEFVYTIKISSGQLADVFGCKILNDQMLHVQIGDRIKIIFKGTRKGKEAGKNKYKIFEVFKDDGETQEKTHDDSLAVEQSPQSQ